MKSIKFVLAVMIVTLGGGNATGANPDPERWGDYLDFAYVYTSADPEALKSRLDQYGDEAGISLGQYVIGFLDDSSVTIATLDETVLRRKAIAQLLQYLSSRDPELIERAAVSAAALADASDSYESRYWFHYINAHRSMERGNATEFVGDSLSLWMNVVVPLEAPFGTLEALSLSNSPSTGFVSALPYVFENVSRMILIRSQEMGLRRSLDPLAMIVRLLHEGRVGANPEVIPEAASSLSYLDRIVARLDGPESDSGSLTFTLLLFEAGKYHDQARGLLASEGFSEKTLKAISVASGAYKSALDQAMTTQGEAAVYMRVLRQIGEIAAAKQRLVVDPYVETPFTIEGAIAIYDKLHRASEDDGWKDAGFRRVGHEAYLSTLRGLWEEIQESSLNAADHYLARSLAATEKQDEFVRGAAQTYTRYLALFEKYVGDDETDLIPDSAYFAAYEAAKGYGDAFTNFASRNATASEMEVVTRRYLQAMHDYPFDPHMWPAFAASLERLGRSGEYLGLARPVADSVTRSRHVNSWINNEKPGHEDISVLRRALSDDLVLMYLGFAASSEMDELNASLDKLRLEKNRVEAKLAWLKGDAQPLQSIDGSAGPASPSPLLSTGEERPINMTREIARTRILLDKLQRKVDARERALPLYKAALGTDELIRELRSQRDHPVHTLLRRMYHEKRSSS